MVFGVSDAERGKLVIWASSAPADKASLRHDRNPLFRNSPTPIHRDRESQVDEAGIAAKNSPEGEGRGIGSWHVLGFAVIDEDAAGVR